MNKKGFTLVELSIVLVIIGLLIGGILAAQSMISTAKIQSVVRQLQQFDVAVTNFQTKYNQLPGDSNLFGTGGNNDGIILNGSNTAETDKFWTDLSQGTNLKNSVGTDYATFDITTDVNTLNNCPRFNLAQNSSASPCLWAWSRDFGYGVKNYFQYDGSTSGILGTNIIRNIVKSSDALAIDQKIDDGIANSGKVMTGFGAGGAAVYNLSSYGYTVEMLIEIGSTAVNTNN